MNCSAVEFMDVLLKLAFQCYLYQHNHTSLLSLAYFFNAVLFSVWTLTNDATDPQLK